jgi:deoxyhypusine synthase
MSGPITQFLNHHFRHFNAGTTVKAAAAFASHLNSGGKMMVAIAGAISTSEIGLSLAEMIRQNKVHAVTCTGANLEEDVFNLVAHDHYVDIPDYRTLNMSDERTLRNRGLLRVTDRCIPEREAVDFVVSAMERVWVDAEHSGVRKFPHEAIFQVLQDREVQARFQTDPGHSWLYCSMEKGIPIFVPGWEDSTLGNSFAVHCVTGAVSSVETVRSGVEYMIALIDWYQTAAEGHDMGFFQIGGGIAGDFPICVVPLLRDELCKQSIPVWKYFCQISDSTTSYGSYSGAPPSEKITWGKLDEASLVFTIESDASIVAPLIFAYVLDW